MLTFRQYLGTQAQNSLYATAKWAQYLGHQPGGPLPAVTQAMYRFELGLCLLSILWMLVMLPEKTKCVVTCVGRNGQRTLHTGKYAVVTLRCYSCVAVLAFGFWSPFKFCCRYLSSSEVPNFTESLHAEIRPKYFLYLTFTGSTKQCISEDHSETNNFSLISSGPRSLPILKRIF